MTSTKRQSTARCLFLAACIAAAVLLAASAASAQPRSAVSTTTSGTRAAPADQADGQRDVLVMLDNGPLHMRLHVALGGVALAQTRDEYVARLIESFDENKDGKLSRDEAQKSPILRTKERPGAAQFLQSLKAQSNLIARDVRQRIDALGGELIAYRQDLASSQNDVEVFKLLDTDSSGLLDAAEMEAAAALIMLKDTDNDQCVSFEEFFPPPPPPDPMLVAAGLAEQAPAPPMATIADMIRSATEPLIAHRLVKRYDKPDGATRRRDAMLSASELGWSEERVAAIDADGNRLLDLGELANISQGAPDIEMSVDLRALDAAGGLLHVLSTVGERLDDATRLDYAKISFDSAVVTFSHRNLDPVADAIDDAMQQFNLLDADANGYLSRDEVAERIRFQRELFDLMDGDGDDKVFVDEMKAYVKARAEPAAGTCRVNVYDAGNGYFMALDTNADGRVSEREKRKAAQSLA
ncbi:MAG TPA: hypothetical protein VFV87_18030, partial [Pirellulaceae bacterium]|nr:hypothetical protein [Pirellulaceae bacterium]